MTDTSAVADWPHIQALTRPDGTGELTINGTSHPIETSSTQQARDEIVRRVVETATKASIGSANDQRMMSRAPR